MIDEAIDLGKRVCQMEICPKDPELYRFGTAGLSVAYCMKGETLKSIKTAQAFFEYGQKHSISACMADGHFFIGANYFISGDSLSMIDCGKKSLQYESEPLTYYNAKVLLAGGYMLNGQYEEAQIIYDEILKLIEESGYLYLAMRGRVVFILGMVMKGNLNQGFRMLEDLISQFKGYEDWTLYCQTNYMLGKIYLKMIQGEGDKSFAFFAKNIGFLIKTFPFVKQKAEKHLKEAIRIAREIGAKGVLAQAFLDMGALYQLRGSIHEARKYISDAIQLFEECENDFSLKQAREILSSL